MIAYLEGEMMLQEANSLVLKTSSGVGYAVNVTEKLINSIKPNEFLTLHVYTNVREDDLSLYGFSHQEEKKLFEMLIKTSGVGPKLGLAILSAIPPKQMVTAVQIGNADCFSQVSGIGKKTAAKLCLDMKDQIKKHPMPGIVEDSGSDNISSVVNEDKRDAVFSALKNMGFTEKEISSVINHLDENVISFEDRLKKALSLLTKLG